MARYFFHIASGDEHNVDDVGRELHDDAAARAHAHDLMRAISIERIDQGREVSGLKIQVVDARNALLFEARFGGNRV